MPLYKEYNYSLPEKELISISNQGDPQIGKNGRSIIYNKRAPNGAFIEQYILDGQGFASVNQQGEIQHTYSREVGAFSFGCNIRYQRNDGREYFAQNPINNLSSLPYSEDIDELIQGLAGTPIEVIYVEKSSGPEVYIIVRQEE